MARRSYHGVSQRQYKRDAQGRFARNASYNRDPDIKKENRVRERNARKAGVNPIRIHDNLGVIQRRGRRGRVPVRAALGAATPLPKINASASQIRSALPSAGVSAPALSGRSLKPALIAGTAVVAVSATSVAARRVRNRRRSRAQARSAA